MQAQLPPFRRHRLGQHLDAAFGHGVGRDGGAGEVAGERADIDDLALLARRHPLGGFAPDHERAGEIGVDHALPIRGGQVQHGLAVLDAGIVDENVHRDPFRIERLKSGNDGGLVGHVEAGFMDSGALGAQFRSGLREAAGIDTVEHDGRPSSGKPFGHGAPQSTGRARDQSGFAGEIKEFERHGSFLVSGCRVSGCRASGCRASGCRFAGAGSRVWIAAYPCTHTGEACCGRTALQSARP